MRHLLQGRGSEVIKPLVGIVTEEQSEELLRGPGRGGGSVTATEQLGSTLHAPRAVNPSSGAEGSTSERIVHTSLVSLISQLSVVRRRVFSPTEGDGAVYKFIRYSMVAGVGVVIGNVTILICAALLHLSGILANTIGTLAATPVSYELNRKWVWGKRGKSHPWKEVAPFWGLTLVGYLASTGTVQIADDLCASHHVTGFDRAYAIMGASLFAYGVVWIAKFVIFNRVVFSGGPARAATGASLEQWGSPVGAPATEEVPRPGPLVEQAKPSVVALKLPGGG